MILIIVTFIILLLLGFWIEKTKIKNIHSYIEDIEKLSLMFDEIEELFKINDHNSVLQYKKDIIGNYPIYKEKCGIQEENLYSFLIFNIDFKHNLFGTQGKASLNAVIGQLAIAKYNLENMLKFHEKMKFNPFILLKNSTSLIVDNLTQPFNIKISDNVINFISFIVTTVGGLPTIYEAYKFIKKIITKI